MTRTPPLRSVRALALRVSVLRRRVPGMPRSWTRLLEHLGVPPGLLAFDMVA
jgi:hypothetical protein